MDNNRNDIKKFFAQSKFLFSRVPIKPLQEKDFAAKSTIYSIATGLLINWGIQKIPGYDTSSIFDEVTVLSAIISAFFFGKLRDIRMLCQTIENYQENLKNNRLSSGLGGAGVGLGTSGLLIGFKTALGLSDLLLTGGAITLTLLSAGAAIVAVNRINKKPKQKECPRCHDKKGRCNQRVCRGCYKIFYPEKVTINCNDSQSYLLDWKTIALYLDQHKLSYLDAEILVYENISDWKIKHSANDDTIYIYCDSFIDWVNYNKDKLFDYIGKGKEKYTCREASTYLDESGL